MKEEKNTVNILYAKTIFLGPPERGKTVTRRHLVGEILNIGSETYKHCSTGTIYAHTYYVKNIDRSTVLVNDENWIALNTADEGGVILKLLNASDSSSTSQLLHDGDQQMQCLSENKSESEYRSSHEFTSTDGMSDVTTIEMGDDHNVEVEKMQTNSSPIKTGIQQAEMSLQKKRDILKLLEDCTKTKNWKKISDSFKNATLLYFHDTGGQPELMDMLPALTIGPALYLLFCRLIDEMNDKFTLCYRAEDGQRRVSIESTQTVGEHLVSVLSSISCMMSCSKMKSSDTKYGIQISSPSNPIVCLLGTYKDELRHSDDLIKFEANIKHVIKPFCGEDSIVHYCSSEHVIYPVDNRNGTEEDRVALRKFVEGKIKDSIDRLQIPARWLVFSLVLRDTKAKVITLQECIKTGGVIHMGPEETKLALWFFHVRAGILMYFRNVPGLEGIVIIDNQVVYDTITKLIIKALGLDWTQNPNIPEKRKLTGQFKLEVIEGACLGTDLSSEFFIYLLRYLYIIAIVPGKKEEDNRYFMPCLLNSATAEELGIIEKEEENDLISSLLITFKCGFVPIGVFTAVIAHLATLQQSKNVSCFYYKMGM